MLKSMRWDDNVINHDRLRLRVCNITKRYLRPSTGDNLHFLRTSRRKCLPQAHKSYFPTVANNKALCVFEVMS
jgi:hypothetical protein